ncbi:MAG: GTPase Era [Oscillospiraceae bacterium]|nr:GTPase Era [Oscillospiraceae bacterium]MBQ9111481.1 GTPase Era [Oscillospiraceae bacterium]
MTKTIFLTLSGRTNAGKSTLLNALIGEKIAAVSSKSQTTRTRITGILTKGDTQYVFIDTPGLHKPKNKLSTHMLKTAESSATDADAVLYVIDCTKKLHEQDEAMLRTLRDKKIACIIVVNKIDLLQDKSAMMPLLLRLNNEYNPHAIIPVSASAKDGIDEIMAAAEELAQPSVHFFPDDSFTDQPERVLAAEMIREKLLRLLNEEVPHGIAVTVETMKERQDKDLLDISAVIYCERDSHKGIIIGKHGSMLKKIASSARRDLENFFEIQVNLQCFVKVKEGWRNKEGLIRSFGLSEE